MNALGCQSLADLYPKMYGADYPVTCAGATSPDNAIISTRLVPHVSAINVLGTDWVATHQPVTFRLQLPMGSLLRYAFRTPKQVIDLGITDCLDSHPVTSCDFQADTLEQWGDRVEQYFDTVLRDQPGLGTNDRLPKSYRGRCKPNKLVQSPLMLPVKQACHGIYGPPCEVTCMRTRAKIKQVRRLESLAFRVRKHESKPASDSNLKQLHQEWLAIVHDRSFGEPFLHWLCHYLPSFPEHPLPSHEWLHEACQFVRYHVNACLRSDLKLWEKREHYMRHLDQSMGSKQAFAKVRGPSAPPIKELRNKITADVCAVCQDSSDHATDIKGPATSLAYFLGLIDWKLSPQGILEVSAFESFPLVEVSQRRLYRFLLSTWQQDHFIMKTDRTHAFHCPDPDRITTIAILKHFSSEEQTSLLREIGWGYQLQTQKDTWCNDADGSCIFCSEMDSRRHRLLSCPIGDHVRAPFATELTALEDTLLPDFPFATVSPLFQWHRTLHFRQPWPEVSEAVKQGVEDLRRQQVAIHWATDGSCSFPELPTCRFAAFSIMMDTCSSDHDRMRSAASFVQGEAHHSTWRPLIATRCTGEQDILRAELSAICYLVVTFACGTIHTDSQAAIDMIQKVRQCTCPRQFGQMEHFDLLLLIWQHRDALWILHKTAAHADFQATTDLLERYWQIGNMLADSAAKEACQQLQAPFVESLQDEAQRVQLLQSQLRVVFNLHLKLQQARISAEHNVDTGRQPCLTKDKLCVAFSDWAVSDPWSAPAIMDESFLDFCPYGSDNVQDMLAWLRMCRWPHDTDGPMG
eukprot:Skav236452  [mRNA]  locus=scaffold1758:170356:174349:+ [translate_table: standard]